MGYELAESVLVQASPREVFGLVSDVTRTGEWSPVCYACEWNSDGRGVGATFTGHNRNPEREWSTVSTVVANTPDEEFAWEVGAGRARWGYRIAAAPDGATELTEYTVFGPTTEAVFTERYGDRADDEIAKRRDAAAAGIPVTLQRIKAIAEGAVPGTD
ncbi:SRPBCC family protein [Brooklawnia cerclae]|uniref:SRPBCC family protein n=1 Tax=Brooklawnia cerclae TaxID=349934 RepID=A0ABX0SMX6_9ACTN|nr:SRPBCC family protein [Brooklawnia cerclae]NIH58121.1 hypothetical protein [Brooklawnia cerclae]